MKTGGFVCFVHEESPTPGVCLLQSYSVKICCMKGASCQLDASAGMDIYPLIMFKTEFTILSTPVPRWPFLLNSIIQALGLTGWEC